MGTHDLLYHYLFQAVGLPSSCSDLFCFSYKDWGNGYPYAKSFYVYIRSFSWARFQEVKLMGQKVGPLERLSIFAFREF